MKKVITILMLIVIMLLATSGARADGLKHTELFETGEFEEMLTTAYCLHGTTATGGTTRPGIAACNTHVGEIAVIYTMEGEYLGMFEITDTGGTDGLMAGTVIDVWFDTLEECEEWMRITQGRAMVRWIGGVG